MKLEESHLERVHIHDLIKPMTAGSLVMVSLPLPDYNAKGRNVVEVLGSLKKL